MIKNTNKTVNNTAEVKFDQLNFDSKPVIHQFCSYKLPLSGKKTKCIN